MKPVSEQGASPATRSAAAIPSNIRRTLEESNLPIEVATAIADRLEAQPVGGEAGELCDKMRKQATCIYIAVEKTVADDIADTLRKAAALIERKQVEWLGMKSEVLICQEKLARAESDLSALKARLAAPCEEESPIDEIYKQIGDVRPGSSLEAALYHADEAWGDLYRKWQEAQEKIYVLGTWRCAKCNLRLVATHLDAASGDMSANNEPQQCANGCGPMWRVTEREERQEAQRSFNAEWERAKATEQHLGDLLAVIHRDGGHYQSTYGTEKAVSDAHTVWAELIGAKEAAEQRADEAVARERETGELLRNIIAADDSNSGCEPSVSVLYREIEAAREAIRARSEGEGNG